MNSRKPSADEIFERASQLSVEQRAAYLKEAVQGDEQLHQRIEALLEAHEHAGDFLKAPLAGVSSKTFVITTNMLPVTEKPGDKIGRYKLREQIGEGGCGVVYVAEQEEPVRRRVALKVIKLGMDTRQVVARFEAERQALALMDHPNIAKVLDAGATDTGRPYFVMELVRGIKITDYCDKNNLSTEDRLKLFIQVCSAIQHAHQKGIIHRDIKPSNILVTLHDGVPVPKVIDFGIAKATTDQRLTDKTIYTAFEQFIGTPAYMSPEQAEMSGLDIDTRSDIYSLGVLLYELLTSRTPFDAATLLKAGLDQMRRIIREEEPVRPSTRLTTLAREELTAVSKHRQAEAAKLASLVRGDLDWIVMKCLEKDRTRRYETAYGVASDIGHYLNNEPVTAAAPSALYKLRKFARRNKVALGVAAMLAFLSTALLVSTLLLFKEFQAAKYTGITVNSNPQGAGVWHDGRMIGITPFKVVNLPTGDFTYSLVLSNCETVTNTTRIVSRKQMNDFTFLRQGESHSAGTAASTNIAHLNVAASSRVTIVALEGTVEVCPRGATTWVIATPNLDLAAGDRLRTGSKSRATLRLSDLSIFRVSELTEIEILPPEASKLEKPSLKLKGGILQFLKGDSGSNSIHLKTPAGRVGIEG